MANITVFHWRDNNHPQIGGSTMNIIHVVEHLASQGHQVTFLTEKYAANLPETEVINGVTFVRRGNKLSQYIVLPLYFLKHLRKNTDLVIEAYDAWPFLTPILHKKVIMLICHIQKEEWAMEFGKFLGPILKVIAALLLKIFYRNSDIVSISQSTNNSIVSEGIASKSLSIIPVGIEELLFTGNIPTKRTDRIMCCTPGRLKTHKRVDLAIDLVAQYNTQQRPENGQFVYFDIIGAGDHEPALRQQVKDLKMDEYIIFHGRASDEIKRDLLTTAHLHLQFSKREGWGITVTEAACQGAPTLCFDIPGLRDSVTENTGYLVKDKAELFERFPKIIADIENQSESYKSRVMNGFEFAQQFRWGTIYKQWDDFIGRVLAR